MKTFYIEEEINNYLWKSSYEYEHGKDIIAFLMTKDNINQEQLNKYLSEQEEKFKIVQLIKEYIIETYNLKDYAIKNNYYFDFINNLIIFPDAN